MPADDERTDPKGPKTIALEVAVDRADDALDNERDARHELSDVLLNQLDQERTRSRWMTRVFVGAFILVLIMLGASVGLVSSGTITFPGFATVNIGADDHIHVMEPLSIEPDESIIDEEPADEVIEVIGVIDDTDYF